MVVIFK